MLKNLYQVVGYFANDLCEGRDLNFYSFLGGVILLVNRPEEELKENFKEENDLADIEQCRKLVAQYDLNSHGICEGLMTVLQGAVCLDDEVVEFKKLFHELWNDDEEIMLSDLLQKVLETKKDELEQMRSNALSTTGKNKTSFDMMANSNSELYHHLSGKVRGQSEAIRLFVRGLFQGKVFSNTGAKKPGPRNVFLLSGPVGTGKTSLAQETARALCREYLEIDLNEYAIDGPGAADYLFAPVIEDEDAPPPGKVTYFVNNCSQGIILFKNLENADPKILSVLSHMLDTGFVGERRGNSEPVALKDNIIIFSSTLGIYLSLDDREKNVSVLPQPMILSLLKQEIANTQKNPLLLDFFDMHFSANNIIMMNYVSLYHLSKMVQDTFADFGAQMQELYGVATEIDPLITNVFLYTQSDDSNARATVRQSESFLKDEIYEFSRHLQKGQKYSFKDLEKITFKVKPPVEAGPVRSLFVNETVSEVLVVADKALWLGVQGADNFNLNFAANYEEAMELLKEKDIKFCIIDLYYEQGADRGRFISLDDVQSVGLECFEQLRRTVEDLPIYMLDRNNIDREDKATFLQRGVRDFITLPAVADNMIARGAFKVKKFFGQSPEEAENIREQIDRIAQSIYAQGKRSMMNAKNKVLTFNTAQEISDDGKNAVITFYDFSTRGTNLEGHDIIYDVVNYHPEGKIGDYIGSEKIKKELQHLSTYLVSPRQYVINEGAVPGGILLFGPEGVGKSVLARYLAGEADATLVAPDINQIQSVDPRYLEEIFKVARKCAPSVIFINHLDKIGLDASNNGENLRSIIRKNLVKSAKDVQHPVLFVGAIDFDGRHLGRDNTNIDTNLLNLLDYKINVPLPNKDERKQFLQKLLTRVKDNAVSQDAVDNIVERTIWLTFDDLEEFFKVAVRIAKRNGRVLDDAIFVGALDEFTQGGTTERDEKLHWEVAIHEAGHAYMLWKSGDPSPFATITPRENYGGYVAFKMDEKESYRGTREEMLWKIRTAMASRAAEITFLGRDRGINSSIAGDFPMATNCALNIICWYGMDEDWLISMPPDVVLRTSLAGDVMKRVNNLLKREFQNTLVMITEGRDAVEALAKALLDKNQLTGKEIGAIIEAAEKK